MQDSTPLPSFAAIVVAAGKGLRAGQPLPKQFAIWRGKPVLPDMAVPEEMKALSVDVANCGLDAAGDRLRVCGPHLPFPALGHLRRLGAGFEYLPEIWRFG